jgi:hypothetical protein
VHVGGEGFQRRLRGLRIALLARPEPVRDRGEVGQGLAEPGQSERAADDVGRGGDAALGQCAQVCLGAVAADLDGPERSRVGQALLAGQRDDPQIPRRELVPRGHEEEAPGVRSEVEDLVGGLDLGVPARGAGALTRRGSSVRLHVRHQQERAVPLTLRPPRAPARVFESRARRRPQDARQVATLARGREDLAGVAIIVVDDDHRVGVQHPARVGGHRRERGVVGHVRPDVELEDVLPCGERRHRRLVVFAPHPRGHDDRLAARERVCLVVEAAPAPSQTQHRRGPLQPYPRRIRPQGSARAAASAASRS